MAVVCGSSVRITSPTSHPVASRIAFEVVQWVFFWVILGQHETQLTHSAPYRFNEKLFDLRSQCVQEVGCKMFLKFLRTGHPLIRQSSLSREKRRGQWHCVAFSDSESVICHEPPQELRTEKGRSPGSGDQKVFPLRNDS